jgi:hypothetical protein
MFQVTHTLTLYQLLNQEPSEYRSLPSTIDLESPSVQDCLLTGSTAKSFTATSAAATTDHLKAEDSRRILVVMLSKSVVAMHVERL